MVLLDLAQELCWRLCLAFNTFLLLCFWVNYQWVPVAQNPISQRNGSSCQCRPNPHRARRIVPESVHTTSSASANSIHSHLGLSLENLIRDAENRLALSLALRTSSPGPCKQPGALVCAGPYAWREFRNCRDGFARRHALSATRKQPGPRYRRTIWPEGGEAVTWTGLRDMPAYYYHLAQAPRVFSIS